MKTGTSINPCLFICLFLCLQLIYCCVFEDDLWPSFHALVGSSSVLNSPSPCRSGSRTDAPNGRSARRPPTSSGLRGLSCRRTTACLSSRPPRQQRRPWGTAFAPSTPTTPAGPRRGCPACLSCSYRRLWDASRAWRSPCLSAASAPARHPTPWVYPTCRRTAPGYSRTSTSPLSPEWYPRPCPGRPT